jgi:hypothetical protein
MNRRKAMRLVLGSALSAPVIVSGSNRAKTASIGKSQTPGLLPPLPSVTSREYAKAMGLSQAEVIRRFSPAFIGGELVSGSSAAIHLFPGFQTTSTEGRKL